MVFQPAMWLIISAAAQQCVYNIYVATLVCLNMQNRLKNDEETVIISYLTCDFDPDLLKLLGLRLASCYF